jgi:hypothetical protein
VYEADSHLPTERKSHDVHAAGIDIATGNQLSDESAEESHVVHSLGAHRQHGGSACTVPLSAHGVGVGHDGLASRSELIETPTGESSNRAGRLQSAM